MSLNGISRLLKNKEKKALLIDFECILTMRAKMSSYFVRPRQSPFLQSGHTSSIDELMHPHGQVHGINTNFLFYSYIPFSIFILPKNNFKKWSLNHK